METEADEDRINEERGAEAVESRRWGTPRSFFVE